MRTVLLAVALAALSSSCSRDAASPPRVADNDAAQLLHRRVWLDEEPRTEHDRFHILFFDREKTGVYQDRTVWKGSFELFRYQAGDGGLVLKLPGSKRVVKTGYKIERVKHGKADLRLTLDESPDEPKVYWGYKFEHDDVDLDTWVEAQFGAADLK